MLQRGRVALITATSVVATFTGGCGGESKPPQETQSAYAPRPASPGPEFPAESVETVSLDRIEKYAARLRFDTVPGAADQLLVDFERSRVGTQRAQQLQIEPERESYNLSEKDLARGRIIARLRSEVAVPKLGLGPWWTWWWVDSTGGRWRSVFIHDSGKAKSRVALAGELTIMNRHYQWSQAIARFWVVRDSSPQGDPIWVESWGTCGGCCKQRLLVLAPE